MLVDIKKLKVVKNNDLVEIDKDMVDTILYLNKKGYVTNFCCSGHSANRQLYIQFKYTPKTLNLVKKTLSTLLDISLVDSVNKSNYYEVSIQSIRGRKTIYFGVIINNHKHKSVNGIKEVNELVLKAFKKANEEIKKENNVK